MLDVHVPHKSEHTWTDFFIHIGTIAVGLLLAIGLEQSVEFIHHRHEAHHAHELLADEMSHNLNLVRDERYVLARHENYLFADLLVIDRMRKHAIAPADRIVLYHPYALLASSAWETAKQSQLLALLPYEEVRGDALIYQFQDEHAATMAESMAALQNANAMRYHSAADRFDNAKSGREGAWDAYLGKLGDAAARAAFEDQAPGAAELAKFTPAQIDRLEQTVQQAIYEDERLLNRCHWLENGYKSRLQN